MCSDHVSIECLNVKTFSLYKYYFFLYFYDVLQYVLTQWMIRVILLLIEEKKTAIICKNFFKIKKTLWIKLKPSCSFFITINQHTKYSKNSSTCKMFRRRLLLGNGFIGTGGDFIALTTWLKSSSAYKLNLNYNRAFIRLYTVKPYI